MNDIIKVMGLTSFALFVGLVCGENHRGKGTMFNYWYGKEFYYNQRVKINPKVIEGDVYDKLKYTQDCERPNEWWPEDVGVSTVIGIVTIKGSEYYWVKTAPCGLGLFDLQYFTQEELVAY